MSEYPKRLRPLRFLWCWFVVGHAGPIERPCEDCGAYVSYHAAATRFAQSPIWLRIKKSWMDYQFHRERTKRLRGLDDDIPF